MAQELRCPACKSLIDMSSTSCQICLRPISRQEIVRALQAGKKQEKKRRQLILGLAAVLAVAGALAARPDWRGQLLRTVKPIAAPLAHGAKAKVESTIEKNWPNTTKESDAVTPQQSFDRASNPDQAAKTTPATPPPPAPTTAEPPKPAVPAEPVAPVGWTISGLIYTMRDAKPAAGVEVSLTATEGGARKTARTGADGRYTIDVPILSGGAGYRIVLRKAGRELPYLEEAALPYRSRSKAQREDAVEEARQSPVLHAPLTPETADTTQDFALLP